MTEAERKKISGNQRDKTGGDRISGRQQEPPNTGRTANSKDDARRKSTRPLHEIQKELAEKPAPAVIQALLHEIGTTRDVAAIKDIAPWLKHENTNVRVTAVEALMKIRSLKALAYLVDAYGDKSGKVKSAVLGSLRRFNRSELIREIKGLILSGGRRSRLAVDILSKLGDPMSHATLISLLGNESASEIHSYAAGLLSESEGIIFTLKFKCRLWFKDIRVQAGLSGFVILVILMLFLSLKSQEPSPHTSHTAPATSITAETTDRSADTGASLFGRRRENRFTRAATAQRSFQATQRPVQFDRDVPITMRNLIAAESDPGLAAAEQLMARGFLAEAEKELIDVLIRADEDNFYLRAFALIELAEVYKRQGRDEDAATIVEEYMKAYSRIHMDNYLESIDDSEMTPEYRKKIEEAMSKVNHVFFTGVE